MFTELVLQMISLSEETDTMVNLQGEVADFYEQEVDYDLKVWEIKLSEYYFISGWFVAIGIV